MMNLSVGLIFLVNSILKKKRKIMASKQNVLDQQAQEAKLVQDLVNSLNAIGPAIAKANDLSDVAAAGTQIIANLTSVRDSANALLISLGATPPTPTA
jgi:hypothetical protein